MLCRLRSAWWVLVLAACPAGINPVDVKPADLVGFWLNEGQPASGTANQTESRVFGFAVPPAPQFSVPAGYDYSEQNLSAVYTGGTPFRLASPQQYATFEVAKGKLTQTVIDDVNFDPGTVFSTEIRSLVPQSELVLGSTSSADGQRTYRYAKYCPAVLSNGFSLHVGSNCPGAGEAIFSSRATMAFDSEGRLHSYVAQAGGTPSAVCAPKPNYAVLDKGCEAADFAAPNSAAASLAIDEADGVHLVYASFSFNSAPDSKPDGTLVHRYQAKNSREIVVEDIAPPATTYFVKAFAKYGRLAVITHRGSNFELHEKLNGAWKTRTFKLEGLAVSTPATPLDAAMGPNGIVFSTSRGVYEEGTPDFRPIAPPRSMAQPVGKGVFVDEAGRVHQAWRLPPTDAGADTSMAYGLWDGTQWRTIALDMGDKPISLILAKSSPPYELMTQNFDPFPKVEHVSVDEAGAMRVTTLMSENPLAEARQEPTSAVASDGTIALTRTGDSVYVRRPMAPWGVTKQGTLKVVIEGKGAGRVYSRDGRVDCTSTCEASVGIHEAVLLHLEPDPTCCSVASGGTKRLTELWAEMPENGPGEVHVQFRRHPLVEPPLTTSGSIQRFDEFKGALAFASTHSAGQPYRLGNDSLTVSGTNSTFVLVTKGADGVARAKYLPAMPDALKWLENGELIGLFAPTSSLNFEGSMATVTATTKALFRVVWDGELNLKRVERVTDLVAVTTGGTTPTRIARMAVDRSGTVAALARNLAGIPDLPAGTFNALVFRDENGTATWTPIAEQIDDSAAAPARLSLSGRNVALVIQNDTMLFFDGPTRTASRTFTGATVFLVQAEDGAWVALATANAQSVDFGLGAEQAPGQVFELTMGFDGQTRVASRSPHASVFSFAKLGSRRAVIEAVLGNSSSAGTRPQFGYWGATASADIFSIGTPDTSLKVLSAVADADVWWVVMQQLGTIDYGFVTVTGAQFVIAKVKLQ